MEFIKRSFLALLTAIIIIFVILVLYVVIECYLLTNILVKYGFVIDVEVFKLYFGIVLPIVGMVSAGLWSKKGIDDASYRFKKEWDRREEKERDESELRLKEIAELEERRQEEKYAKFRPIFVLDDSFISPKLESPDIGIRNIQIFDIQSESIVLSKEYMTSSQSIDLRRILSGHSLLLICETLAGEVVVFAYLYGRYQLHLKYIGPVRFLNRFAYEDSQKNDYDIYAGGLQISNGCQWMGEFEGNIFKVEQELLSNLLYYYEEMMLLRAGSSEALVSDLDDILLSSNYLQLFRSILDYIYTNWESIDGLVISRVAAELFVVWLNSVYDTEAVVDVSDHRLSYIFNQFDFDNNIVRKLCPYLGSHLDSLCQVGICSKCVRNLVSDNNMFELLDKSSVEDGSITNLLLFNELFYIIRNYSRINSEEQSRDSFGHGMTKFLFLIFDELYSRCYPLGEVDRDLFFKDSLFADTRNRFDGDKRRLLSKLSQYQ